MSLNCVIAHSTPNPNSTIESHLSNVGKPLQQKGENTKKIFCSNCVKQIINNDIPLRPVPPPCRIIREGSDLSDLCRYCGSTMSRQWPKFWIKKCDQPRCKSNTIPDEPLEEYIKNDWRGITKYVFETKRANAFLRLTRNHEQKIGLWTWPETFFKNKHTFINKDALWLRNNGYYLFSDMYSFNTNRIISELFY